MENLGAILVILGGIGIWYFIKKEKDNKKRNISIGLTILGILLIGIFGTSTNNESTSIDSETTTKTSEKEIEALYVNEPDYYFEEGNFTITGRADVSKKVQIKQNGESLKTGTPTESNTFEITLPLPDTEDTTFVVSDGETKEDILIKSKETLHKEIAAEEAKKKAEEEQKAKKEQAAKEAEEKRKAEEAAVQKKKEEEAAAAQKKKEEEEAAKNNPDTYRTGITYDQLARTPDDYMFKKVAFSGKIIQVIEGDDSSQYRLAVDGNYDTVMLIEISNEKLSTRILEDDLVSVYGLSMGTISYDSTMGGKITIPGVIVNIFTIDGQG